MLTSILYAEEMFTALAGGKQSDPVQESAEADQDSRQYLMINTHKGLYRYTRLPWRVPLRSSRKRWRPFRKDCLEYCATSTIRD